MRLLMGNLIFFVSGVASRETMKWSPESGIGNQKALNARSISSS